MSRVVKSQFVDVDFHVACEGQGLDELHQFGLGSNREYGPKFRIFKGKGIIEDFPFVEEPVDGGALVRNTADELFR